MFNIQEIKGVNMWCSETRKLTMIKTFVFISTQNCPIPNIHQISTESRWSSTTQLH